MSGARGGLEEEVLAARESLHAWCADFERKNGVHPRRREIFLSEEGRKLFDSARRLEKALAGPAPAGNCEQYLWRKRRWCRRQAAEGSRFCSAHEGVQRGEEPEWRHFGEDTSEERKRDAAPRKRKAEELARRQAPSDSYAHPKRNLRRRLKRMSNPFAAQHRREWTTLLDWENIFRNLALPLLLDIGCARGRFLQRLAKEDGGDVLPPHNFLGIELYEPLVEEALSWRDEFLPCPSNLHYLSGNAFQVLQGLRGQLPNLQRVCIQFPDPWGAKHKKRRLVTPEFAELLADILPTSGTIYVASDSQGVAEEIQRHLLGTKAFVLDNRRPDGREDRNETEDGAPANGAAAVEDEKHWMSGRYPYGVPTERDEVCETEWRKVWRCIVRKL